MSATPIVAAPQSRSRIRERYCYYCRTTHPSSAFDRPHRGRRVAAGRCRAYYERFFQTQERRRDRAIGQDPEHQAWMLAMAAQRQARLARRG